MMLSDWLYAYRHMNTTPGLRAVWRDLVLTHGIEHPRQFYHASTQWAHGLKADDMQQLMQATASRPFNQQHALGTLLAGAEPIEVIRFLTAPVDQANLYVAGQHQLVESAVVSHALISNPRITDEHLKQLEAAQVFDLDQIQSSASRLMTSASAAGGDKQDPVLDLIFTMLLGVFGEEWGPWLLFFELWEGKTPYLTGLLDLDVAVAPAREAIEVVRATL